MQSRWLGMTSCALAVVTTAALTGCNSGTSPNPTPSTIQARIQSSAPSSSMNPRFAFAMPRIGEAAPEHLEYFLTSLRLCESLETNGTGFNNAEGCIDVYTNNSVDYDAYGFAEARADVTPGNYFDLMDPSTMTALQQSVTARPGTYRWALATWNRPVRVQASIPLAHSCSGCPNTLYTKDGEPAGTSSSYTLSPTLLSEPSAELAMADLNNGGTWFRLQQPVVIGENDGEYTLSLVFNPDRLLKGWGHNASNASIQDANSQGIHVPLLDLTPVLHRSSEAVRKESYVLTGAAQFSIRLELYSVDSDPNHAILGADVKTLYTDDTYQNIMHPSKISFLSTAEDASTTFEIWDNSPLIEGFTRSATGGTVTLHCEAAFHSTMACDDQETVTLTYAAPTVTTLP